MKTVFAANWVIKAKKKYIHTVSVKSQKTFPFSSSDLTAYYMTETSVNTLFFFCFITQ